VLSAKASLRKRTITIITGASIPPFIYFYKVVLAPQRQRVCASQMIYISGVSKEDAVTLTLIKEWPITIIGVDLASQCSSLSTHAQKVQVDWIVLIHPCILALMALEIFVE
jgi:hypothetical protein